MTATTQPGAAGKFNSREEGLAAIEARRMAELQGEVVNTDGSQVDLAALAQVSTTLDDDTDLDDLAAEQARKQLEAKGKLDDGDDKGDDKPDDKPRGDGRAKEDNIDDGIIVLSPEDLGKYRIRGKVDGEMQEIGLDRALPALQKDAAVEKRLKEATEARRQAQELLEKAKATPDDKAAADKAAKAEEKASDLEAQATTVVRSALDKFYEGDIEGATQELVKVVTGRQQATLDVNQLASTLTQAVESNLNAKSVLAQYRKDYSDIAESEHLTKIADGIFEQLVNDEGWGEEKALFEAGKRTRELIKSAASQYGMTEGKASPTSNRREVIKAKKDDLDPEVRPAGASKSGPSAPPTEEEARRQAIAEMAAQRDPTRQRGGG